MKFSCHGVRSSENLSTRNKYSSPRLYLIFGSGNESDQKQFVQAMKDFKNQLKFDSLMVADSAI